LLHRAIEELRFARVERTKEQRSSSDVAVTTARRLLLDTIAAFLEGELPPGSARSPEAVHIPDPSDHMLERSQSWRELETVD